jgi:anti-sigma factor RsiW
MSDLDCQTATEYGWAARRGRLGDRESEALSRHLSSCAECRERYRVESALDDALRSVPREAAPSALKARLAGAREPKRWGRAAGLLALGLALVLVIALYHLQRSRSESTLATEAVSDHLRLLYADRGPEVESGGIHRVKPWFEGKLDFAPVMPFDGDEEFTLTGGSVAYFVDRKAAAFAFKKRAHVVTLLVFRSDGLAGLPKAPNTTRFQVRGFSGLLWQSGDLGYALVSDTAPADLDRLARKVRGD